jgi:hypothetical protein
MRKVSGGNTPDGSNFSLNTIVNDQLGQFGHWMCCQGSEVAGMSRRYFEKRIPRSEEKLAQDKL